MVNSSYTFLRACDTLAVFDAVRLGQRILKRRFARAGRCARAGARRNLRHRSGSRAALGIRRCANAEAIELRARLVDGRDPVARYFGRSFDAEQLIGGVPLPASRVTTDELPKCAGRAGLAITPAKVPTGHIKSSMLPALIVSEGGDALVVLHRDGERMNALCPVGYSAIG